MCKIGDIILIKNYVSNGQKISKHSFIVLSDEAGKIQGLEYDLICNVMSSFKEDEQRKRKLSYPGNFPIISNDSNVKNGNKKDGYVKAEQLYYFNKDEIDFDVIGNLKDDVLELLIDFIENLKIPLQQIIENL